MSHKIESEFFIACKDKMLDFPKPLNFEVSVRDAISDLAYLQSGEGEINSKYKFPPKSDFQKKIQGKILKFYNTTKLQITPKLPLKS